jgi:hypothetical protein
MKQRRTFRCVWLAALVAVGCTGDLSGSNPRQDANSDVPETKRIERLSAGQFFRSLEVTTGQTWSRAEEYASTLGRPDFERTVAESRDISVSFFKLAGDAAREVCGEAVDADLETSNLEDRVILREVQTVDPLDEAADANLRYLMLRFLGIHITDDLDSRLDPWRSLLQTGLPSEEQARVEQGRDRWKAVCVGLATHPDFLTY